MVPHDLYHNPPILFVSKMSTNLDKIHLFTHFSLHPLILLNDLIDPVAYFTGAPCQEIINLQMMLPHPDLNKHKSNRILDLLKIPI